MDTKIKKSFWTDPDIENLTSDQKLSIIWLLTSDISACGWCAPSKRRFESDTGCPYDALQSACDALGMAIVRASKGLWVRNYIRHQIGSGEQLVKNKISGSVIKSIRKLDDEIISVILNEYPELKEKFHAHKMPMASTPDGVREGEREGEGEYISSNTVKSKKGSAEGKQKEHRYDEEFLKFYDAYPKQEGKRAAEAKWKQLRPNLEICLKAIEQQKQSDQWRKENGQYIPQPSKWLHHGMWENRGIVTGSDSGQNDPPEGWKPKEPAPPVDPDKFFADLRAKREARERAEAGDAPEGWFDKK